MTNLTEQHLFTLQYTIAWFFFIAVMAAMVLVFVAQRRNK